MTTEQHGSYLEKYTSTLCTYAPCAKWGVSCVFGIVNLVILESGYNTDAIPYLRGGVVGAEPISSVPFFFFIFPKTLYLLNITFIFDGCHQSSAAVTPVK